MTNSINKFESNYKAWLAANKTSLIDSDRCYPTAIISGQIFSEEEFELAKAFGYSTLWLFGVDRWFDERTYSEDELLLKLERVWLNAETDDLEEKDLTGRLADLKHNFLNNDQLGQYALVQLKNTLYKGMLFEHQMRFSGVIPSSVEEYLLKGRESIGVKFVNSVVLNSITSTSNNLDFSFISAVQNLSAEIIRLTNDVVTLPKEIIEGNKNFLNLFSNIQIDFAEIIADKRKELIQLDCPQDQDAKRFYRYVCDLVDVTLKFYSHSDFYDKHESLTEKFDENRNKH